MNSRFWNLLSKKMAGEVSTEELDELDELIRENPEWAWSAGQLQRIWKTNPSETDCNDEALAYDHHLGRLKHSGIDFPWPEEKVFISSNKGIPVTKSKYRTLIAVTAILLVITAGLIWKLSPTTYGLQKVESFNEVETDQRSRMKVQLPDSSVVWLNAGSKLIYDREFGISNRNAKLVGEGYFDVKKGKIPFVIHTNEVQIRVLGTVFNVRSYPNEKTETSLLHGSVEITLDQRPGEKYLLKPREKLVVSNLKSDTDGRPGKPEPIVVLESLLPSDGDTYVETAWVKNQLVFEDETFSEVAVKMERWYGVTISIEDKTIAAQRLSGTFTTETIREAMEALQLSTSFQYRMKSNSIVITSK